MRCLRTVVALWGLAGLYVFIDSYFLGGDYDLIAGLSWGYVVAATMLLAAAVDVLFPKRE